VASVLFGATSPEQVQQNYRALERLSDEVLAELRATAA
jgi:aryl-alcohol dehydrogenase-like predicted oxidoreductase